MELNKLLEGLKVVDVDPSFLQLDISSIASDSRKVEKNGLFVALKGITRDGADFIRDAIGKGALVIVGGRDAGQLNVEHAKVCFLTVEDPKIFLHKVTLRFYADPSKKVKTIGVTGTNGKTTVTYLLESIINEAKSSCGVIGTVNYRWDGQVMPALHTTPDFVDIQRFLSELVERNIPYCIMEVSSHALAQERVHGIRFRTAIFTNLTSDHLDYHKTRDSYFAAKARLFTMLTSQNTAVINTDDIYGQQLLTLTKAKVITYGIERAADVMAKNIRMSITETRFLLVSPAGEREIRTKLVGMYNVYNILAAIAACLDHKIRLDAIARGIERLTYVPGRLERVDVGKGFNVFIDFAHTQDALESLLMAIRRVSQANIILVFGCGGDRDTSKRPLMGGVAGRLADFSIVTSDNPRSEDPQAIIGEITRGFKSDNYQVIVNRKEAIARALNVARAGDIVLIVGKGHETYQIFSDKRLEFDERKIIQECLSC